MGIYLGCFSFEVPNENSLLELIIEPAFSAFRAVCFQVHQSTNNVYKAYWNYDTPSRELSKLYQMYIQAQPTKQNRKTSQEIDDPEFRLYLKQHSPVYSEDLRASDMQIVDDVINADFGESRFVSTSGLDGHSYTLKIYEKKYKEYHCWCVIPAEWKELIPLVDMVINIADLNPRDRYVVCGIEKSKQN